MINQDLITAYQSARAVRDAADADCKRLANDIADALGRPNEGQQTHKATELGLTITVKQPVNRKVDWDAFDKACKGLEDQPFTIKRELDLSGLRWYEQNDHEAYLRIAKAITATPGQVQVTIKETGK
jgi:hypothetical protein